MPAMGRRYAETRNFDHGPEDRSNVSALSPHIRHRLMTEAELAQLALEAHSSSAAEKFLQEIFWRTYWKGWLELRPQVWSDYKQGRDHWLGILQKDGALRAAYDDAVGARTGIECFDAWIDELIQHGYLHNHTRMWFASIWIFTLGLPWELGADLFLRHLMDGDAASNTLSWRWVAGLQTQGKTYLARASNIEKFTRGRFSPSAASLAQDAPALSGPPNPPAGDIPLGAPVPNAPYALLLHEDDCGVETVELGRAPERIYVQKTPVARGLGALGDAAARFTAKALHDTAARATDVFECPVEQHTLEALPQELPICAPYAPVGALRDALTEKAEIQWIIRPVDAYFWPFATKGFFKFKSAIPKAIAHFGWRAL